MVPDISSPIWRKILERNIAGEYETLSLKLLLTTLQNLVKRDSNTMSACIEELHNFCVQHASDPNISDDLKKLLAE